MRNSSVCVCQQEHAEGGVFAPLTQKQVGVLQSKLNQHVVGIMQADYNGAAGHGGGSGGRTRGIVYIWCMPQLSRTQAHLLPVT